jgi:vesicle-fusing ATPase
MDAICRKRGSSGSTSAEVGDKIVNQLLTMIDGAESLNNILVIGMTNMKELIDKAILRSGRFEIHIEIGLPNDKGRYDIFKIHTANMYKNKVIDKDVDLNELVG